MKLSFRFTSPASVPAVGVVALILALFVGNAASASPQPNTSFNGPTDIAACGPHLWVTNVSGNSVTEINASTGAIDRIINTAANGFSEPMGISGDGTDVWVTNLSSNSVSEINCDTGEAVRSLSAGTLNAPVAVAVGRGRVWVASQAHQTDAKGNLILNSSVATSFSTSTGSLLKNVQGSNANGLNGSSGVAVGDGKVWITNALGNSISELNAITGHVVRVINGGTGSFDWPMGLIVNGADVWVTNLNGNSLTEINESTGAVLRVISGNGLNGPDSLCVFDKKIWVTNLYGDSVTVLNAKNGAFIRVLASQADRFSAPMGITGHGSTIWVTNQWTNTVTEVAASNGLLQRILH